jgi:nicotinamide-nucleotide amidase
MNTIIANLTFQVSELLQKNSLKLAVAESCTGGGLAYYLTSIPGSSTWFERGLVTYSNLAKQELLGVKHKTLLEYGAVSIETATEMAQGLLIKAPVDISIAITGIAGPYGATADKPVGTVCIAYAKKNTQTITQQFLFLGDRITVREQSIEMALHIILKH